MITNYGLKDQPQKNQPNVGLIRELFVIFKNIFTDMFHVKTFFRSEGFTLLIKC
jgi:hypothetical protein